MRRDTDGEEHGTDPRLRMPVEARSLQAERMASIGTLAAGIAHEINNPLTYLALNLGFISRELGALARELADPGEGETHASLEERRLDLRARVERALEAVRISREGADRVATIVRDLRTFARADEEARGPVDVRRVMDSAIGVAWNEIRHRAKLTKEYSDVAMVVANEARLGQVFLNLLMNATQAIPEGAASAHEIRVVIRASRDNRVCIEVHDTGRGIPPEHLARVFDPFFTTKSVGLATGLGLSICHGIVASLGGDIVCASELGKGSIFRVALPGVSDVEVTSDRTTPSIRQGPRARVLVVDDEPLVSESLRRALEPDAEVAAATSGRDAIDRLLRDQRFDVVLCDLMMPDIAGMDVYDAIRKARPGVETSFVFMTGGAFTSRARQFLAAVPNQKLDKPIDPDELRRVIFGARSRR